ncbi:MAG: nuclease-related domain-containing protein [Gammaproteobacteria bacterium]
MSAFQTWRWHHRVRRLALDTCNDFVLPDGVDGFVHIEHVLLRPEGFYVLDLLEGAGRLIAGERLPEWSLMGKRRRFTFPNPLLPLEHKLTAVRLLAGQIPVRGYVVLADGLVVPRAQPERVVSLGELRQQLPHPSGDAAVAPANAEAWARIKAAAKHS